MTEANGVTFLMCVYNRVEYLPATLEALRRQAGDFPRHYVFVDDGSTDGSGDLIAGLTRTWSDVTLIRQANRGLIKATNRGLEAVGLPYIKIIDADDLLTEQATATLLQAARKTGADVTFAERAWYTEGEAPDLAGFTDPEAPPRILDQPLRQALRHSVCSSSTMLLSTAAVRRAGGCDERAQQAQDYSLAIRIARFGRFCRLDTPVVLVPVEIPGRLSNDENRQMQDCLKIVAGFLHDHPETPSHLQRFACRNAALRTWRYTRRHGGVRYPWRAIWLRLRSYLPLPINAARFVDRCARQLGNANRFASPFDAPPRKLFESTGPRSP